MEIRTLKYFLAVAKEENMSKASEKLHVSQPTLSKQIKALEEELGQKLFIRHSFSLELTDEGRLLKDRAENLVDMADKIEAEFTSMDDIRGGNIYFGLAESHQISYLAKELRKFKEEYPLLHYNITSGDTEQVVDKLDKGILDFVVLAEIPDRSKYDFVAFPEPDIWGLVMPEDSPLTKKQAIKVDDLIGLPLFCSGQGWEKDIPRWAKSKMNKLKLEGTFRLSYNASIFARENLGYLLTFDRIIDVSPGSGLVFRPLTPRLETKLFLVWKKDAAFSPIAERFHRQITGARTKR